MSRSDLGQTDEAAGSNRSSRTAWLLLVLVAVVVAVGAFFLGRSTGEDLDAARARGAEIGKASGVKAGTAKGLAEGKRQAFPGAYKRSYEAAYRKAFRNEGVDPPAKVKVKVPTP